MHSAIYIGFDDEDFSTVTDFSYDRRIIKTPLYDDGSVFPLPWRGYIGALVNNL